MADTHRLIVNLLIHVSSFFFFAAINVDRELVAEICGRTSEQELCLQIMDGHGFEAVNNLPQLQTAVLSDAKYKSDVMVTMFNTFAEFKRSDHLPEQQRGVLLSCKNDFADSEESYGMAIVSLQSEKSDAAKAEVRRAYEYAQNCSKKWPEVVESSKGLRLFKETVHMVRIGHLNLDLIKFSSPQMILKSE